MHHELDDRHDEDLVGLMGRMRDRWLSSATTPVGAALAEFVGADPHSDFTQSPITIEELDSATVDLTADDEVRPTRSPRMRWKKMTAGTLAAIAALALFSSAATAETSLEDGDYNLVLPGIGSFEFTIDSDSEGDTVVAVAAPEGYEVDDDDADKASWKDAASLEVEVKTDKIEGDYDWSAGDAGLSLPDGGTITISAPDADGNFTVTAGGGWYAFGSGSDWIVADDPDIDAASRFFVVEADEDGIEIKPIDEPGDGFLNDLNDDDDDSDHDDDEDDDDEDDEDDDDHEDKSDHKSGKKPDKHDD